MTTLTTSLSQDIRELAAAQDAIILAHNYQLPEVQDVADYVGDSLALSRIAASCSQSTIVFAGVHFMAETAKLLSPTKRVLLPAPAAGCSLADSITAEQLSAWKSQHPGAVVVSYVNTTAAVKALTDICCTSSNAVQVVNSIPADKEILFCPDQFLGAHVRRMTGRENIHIWAGECHVHADISPTDLIAQVHSNPASELFIHPECGCTTSALWLNGQGELPEDRTHILSTGAMLAQAKKTTASKVLVATEVGILHQLQSVNNRTEFMPVNPSASCPFMKMTSLEVLAACLETGTTEIEVSPRIAEPARRAVQRMIEIGTPGGGE